MIRRELLLGWCLWGALAVSENSTEPYSLRLVGGAGRCQGELQVQRAGQDWTGVSPQQVPLWLGNRVCAQLDCGSALNVEEKTVSEREAVVLHTSFCQDTSLIYCFEFESDTQLYEDSLELNCSDSVRLVGGRSMCSGSLQVRDQSLNQSWTGVCEGALDRRGAEVLCRELGCGAPLLQGAISPLGQTFHCEGHESALMDCPRNQSSTDPGTCSTFQLTCRELVSLVGGASRCEGIIEASVSGQWRRVKTYYTWDLGAAAAVCRGLDCGSAVATEMRREFKSSGTWFIVPDCVKKAAVRDCAFTEETDIVLQVKCSDSVLLVGGQSLCSGSLQVRDQSLNQSWTGVCEGALGRRGAEVLCRELGCGAPLLQGALSPLGRTFHCEGNESALMDCPRARTGPETCSTVQLTCAEPLRLVGGASRCEGTVEVEFKGEWRRLTSFGPWSLEAAAGVCRDLDCGSPVSTGLRENLNLSDAWHATPDCVSEAAVRDCIFNGVSGRSDSLQVMCTDLLNIPEVSVSEGDWAPRAQGGVWVPMGADFQVKCSVEPQYPGGAFQLLSPTLNLTLSAVNHTAHFLFTKTSPAHRGSYTCVYLLQVFNHSFTSNSSLHIYPGESDAQFLLRALVLFLLQLLNFIPYFYYRQATRGHQRRQRTRRHRAAP